MTFKRPDQHVEDIAKQRGARPEATPPAIGRCDTRRPRVDPRQELSDRLEALRERSLSAAAHRPFDDPLTPYESYEDPLTPLESFDDPLTP